MKLIYSISKMIEFCKNNPVSGVIYIDLFISRYCSLSLILVYYTVYFAHVTHVIFLRQSICHIVFCQMYVACNKTILSNKPRKKYTSRWFLLYKASYK